MATGRVGLLNPLPNFLDDYDNVTYHFKLFMLPQTITASKSINVEDSGAVVIAESGTTGNIFIENVYIRNVTSTNNKVKASTNVEYSFTLREFNGAALIDNIYLTSLNLGIDSYYKCPYFLELTFKGREVSTSEPIPGPLDNVKWVWPLTILSIETEIDSSGTIYNVKATTYNLQGNLSVNSLILEPVSLDADTVGKAMDLLTEKLNSIAKQKKVSNDGIPDQYEIVIPPEYKKMKIVPPGDVNVVAAGTEVSWTKPTFRNISIPVNTDIKDAITTILSSTTEYQRIAKKEIDQMGPEVNTSSIYRKIHRIDVKTEQIKFDHSRGDYVKKFSFLVIPYSVNTIMTDPSETNLNGKTRATQIINDRLLQKEYNYIFTGENTQILDFNMKFNFGWYAATPIQAGINTDTANSREAKTFTNKGEEYRVLREKINAYAKNVSSMPRDKTINQSELEDYKKQIETAKISEEEKASLNNVLKKAQSNRIDNGSRVNNFNNSNKNSSDESTLVQTSKNPISKFVNDVISSKALTSIKTILSGRKIPLSYKPIPVLENVLSSQSQNYMVEADKGTGRQYMNSVFQSAFSGKTGDLVQLSLTIKGDPYWLEAPLANKTLVNNLSSDQKNYLPSNLYANMLAYENFFLIRLKTPETIDSSTGIMPVRPTTLDGVYGVILVEHHFIDGRFTQVLNGVIDPLVDINDIRISNEEETAPEENDEESTTSKKIEQTVSNYSDKLSSLANKFKPRI